MKKSDFNFNLPEKLIAQEPAVNRDESRLLVLNKKDGTINHTVFNQIIQYTKSGDCLVLNNTRVMPARIYGKKEGTGGKIEFVLLKDLGNNAWEVILKPGKRAKVGSRFIFGDNILKAEVIEICDEGKRIVKFEYKGIFKEILDSVGLMPLPPYITKELDDKERYQTVYSKINGSAAAPTAGLHFTTELLQILQKKGVEICYVTLHIGLGTFRPVKSDDIKDHIMHSEYYEISKSTCDLINNVKANGGRIISVGTTSCRVLETASNEKGIISPSNGETDIFIYPGYKFKIIDGMITNFHLPESTLIMLISALAGRKNVLNAYEEAVNKEYRFFSFGDAMLIIDNME